MASFVGTLDEFIKYINPRVKNVINGLSRAYKAEVGQCEHCGSVDAILEAAHVTGRERPVIIEEVLSDFINGEVITVDLDVFESRLITAHEPIDKIIKALCRPCHIQYDNSGNQPRTTSSVEGPEASQDEVNNCIVTNSDITNYLRENVPSLPSNVIVNLLSAEYCRRIFGVHFSVLKETPLNASIEELREYARINGYNRWSTQNPIIVNGRQFLVLTQWYEKNRTLFVKWKESR
ncbi:MAG: hypothetical protein HWE39_18205 [Oceanospirillaceae bacterium]|nr:hypothetical protein [Oceanospirillaceae bacterium]